MNDSAVAIHVVTSANASLLDRVDDDVFDHEVQPDLLRVFLANPSNLLVVAVASGKVIGMASGIAYVHPDKPLSLFINEVGVSARYHRQGIGRRLIEELLNASAAMGCTQAWVATELSNHAARTFYEAVGGTPEKEHAAVYVYSFQPPPRAW